jgi:hypothetical protein
VGVTWGPVESEPDCVAAGAVEEFVEVGEGLIMGPGEAVRAATSAVP